MRFFLRQLLCSSRRQTRVNDLKIYYMTQVAVKPPTFVIFVNDKELMHFSYTRYLENKISDAFGFAGTSLKFIIRERGEKRIDHGTL